MGKEKLSYAEMLKDPRWQKKKSEIMTRDKFTCQLCGSKDRTLHVHHKYYVDYRAPWRYPDGVLVTLCEDCHSFVHKNAPNKAIGIKVGDVIRVEHGGYDTYGLVFFINYVENTFSTLTIDTGSGFYDCVVYHYLFSEINSCVEKLDSFFEEDNYYSMSLFCCFYGLVNGNENINLDYFQREGTLDSLLLLKYSQTEMLENNQELNNIYITAENGNLSYLED